MSFKWPLESEIDH